MGVRLFVESDCLQVVKLINGEDLVDTELSFFINEAQHLCLMRNVVSIAHISRAHNHLAHTLACRAYAEDGPKKWVSMFPNWLLAKNEVDTSCVHHKNRGSCPICDTHMNNFSLV